MSCPKDGHNSENIHVTLTAEPNRSYTIVCEALNVERPSSNNPATIQGNDQRREGRFFFNFQIVVTTIGGECC